ncbi:MAG: transpeptidase family protein [Saprospiraceae bacterium]|nr:transpeptidase family protein [Saprospiraceae bacterium]
MDRKKELLSRAYLVMAMFILASVVILFKVFKVAFLEREKWRQKGEVNVQWRVVDADRGRIYAEESQLLATSLQFFEVRMDMSVASDELFENSVDSLALGLSQFDPNYIRTRSRKEWMTALKQARKRPDRYFFIAKGLDIEAFHQLKKLPLLRDDKYRGGIVVSRYGKRVKPYGELASRTIGVDRENADRIGLEGYFDKFLKGETDQRLMKRLSAKEDIWVPVYDPSENEIKRGDDIYTTINVDMQDIVHHELLKSLQQNQAEGGVAILMEVKTGAVKAISNLTRASDSSYYEMYNHSVGRRTEPGSTMKLATILAAMEDGMTNLDSMVDLQMGEKMFAGKKMLDSERHNKRLVSISEAFEMSSNVGVASIANSLYQSEQGRLQWIHRLRQFGLNEPTGIDIAGEERPEIKHPVKDKDEWYGTTIPWMAHGYELTLTPLQLLNFYNAVANDGKLMKPYLVSEIRNGDLVKKSFEPVVLKSSIAKAENVARARELMEGVVLRGTASQVQSPYVTFAGKTGTTRTNYTRPNEKPLYNASFCGYFPADKPMYSLIVVVYEPGGVHTYGGTVAAPVFRGIAEKVYKQKTNQVRILNSEDIAAEAVPGKANGFYKDFTAIFDYLEIPHEESSPKTWAHVYPSNKKMNVEGSSLRKAEVPDVRGMGARDAVFLLENMGLKVNLQGVGKVRSQSVAPGVRSRGQRIVLNLQ